MSSSKPYVFNKGNDKIFKLEVCHNDFCLQRTKLLYEKEDLAQSEQADFVEKGNYVVSLWH